ncbi:MAG: hypothetical protein U9P14_05605 [Gemmatimonadota bacterium]|nr:hypothetical protein [Gemmatimonadota bacterium]
MTSISTVSSEQTMRAAAYAEYMFYCDSLVTRASRALGRLKKRKGYRKA